MVTLSAGLLDQRPPAQTHNRSPDAAYTHSPDGARSLHPAHHLLSAMMVLLAQLACSISDESPDARACAP